MKKTKKKSWVEKQLEDPKFREGFEREVEKLSIGEQLIELRHAAGLTQAQLAARAGTSASAVSRYEDGDYDRYEVQTLQRLVAACHGQLRIVIEAMPAKRPAKKVARSSTRTTQRRAV
jgi:transcriptional regulator with XRE-family HTH domain